MEGGKKIFGERYPKRKVVGERKRGTSLTGGETNNEKTSKGN